MKNVITIDQIIVLNWEHKQTIHQTITSSWYTIKLSIYNLHKMVVQPYWKAKIASKNVCGQRMDRKLTSRGVFNQATAQSITSNGVYNNILDQHAR